MCLIIKNPGKAGAACFFKGFTWHECLRGVRDGLIALRLSRLLTVAWHKCRCGTPDASTMLRIGLCYS